jgi:hypothetical protein
MFLQAAAAKIDFVATIESQLHREQQGLPHPLTVETRAGVHPFPHRAEVDVKEFVRTDGTLFGCLLPPKESYEQWDIDAAAVVIHADHPDLAGLEGGYPARLVGLRVRKRRFKKRVHPAERG